MEDKKMAVTAAMVKELREMTGAGMMDCKKALSNTDGDMDKAVEYLRENGMAKAAKKAGRIAAEGIVKVVTEGSKAAIVEVNSETDFVAKNADFNAYVEEVAQQALNTKASDIDEFLAESWNKDSSKTVADVLAGQIAVIGENLKIRRFAQIEENNGFIASYIHMGGKIGVLVDVETDVVNPASVLLPEEIDYTSNKFLKKFRTRYAFKFARCYLNSMIREKKVIIKGYAGSSS